MVLFPKVNNIQETLQYQLVLRYLRSAHWQTEFDDLFAEDIVVDFPHAPFGMLQHMSAFEFSAYRYWLRNTVRSFQCKAEPCVIPTTDPNIFWTIRWITSNVHWAKRDGVFDCEFASRITVRDGKIVDIKEYGNPIAYYKAIGIILPNFNYLMDIVPNQPSARMPENAKSHFTVEENIRRAVNNFANPISGLDEDPESIYAANMIEVTPFAPMDMAETWEGEAFDVQCEWMFRTVEEWNTDEKVPLYRCTDPHIIIVESCGYGKTSWSNCNGHYTQRELQIVHLNDAGKIDHFRVYFNCLNKFNSMNQSIPAFPYFNF